MYKSFDTEKITMAIYMVKNNVKSLSYEHYNMIFNAIVSKNIELNYVSINNINDNYIKINVNGDGNYINILNKSFGVNVFTDILEDKKLGPTFNNNDIININDVNKYSIFYCGKLSPIRGETPEYYNIFEVNICPGILSNYDKFIMLYKKDKIIVTKLKVHLELDIENSETCDSFTLFINNYIVNITSRYDSIKNKFYIKKFVYDQVNELLIDDYSNYQYINEIKYSNVFFNGCNNRLVNSRNEIITFIQGIEKIIVINPFINGDFVRICSVDQNNYYKYFPKFVDNMIYISPSKNFEFITMDRNDRIILSYDPKYSLTQPEYKNYYNNIINTTIILLNTINLEKENCVRVHNIFDLLKVIKLEQFEVISFYHYFVILSKNYFFLLNISFWPIGSYNYTDEIEFIVDYRDCFYITNKHIQCKKKKVKNSHYCGVHSKCDKNECEQLNNNYYNDLINDEISNIIKDGDKDKILKFKPELVYKRNEKRLV